MARAEPREHGGGLDAATRRWGGTRADWIDLSTGINRVPYPVAALPPEAWTALPDAAAAARLERAARAHWEVPDGAAIVAAPGGSALIARLPGVLGPAGGHRVDPRSYNEWDAAFAQAGWRRSDAPDVDIHVHPDNPTGRPAPPPVPGRVTIYDESFADALDPAHSRVGGDALVLKSFGKFWGLAGLRLGWLIGPPPVVARMRETLGPWPVSGPALALGAAALEDRAWAEATRARLRDDAARLDATMVRAGAAVVGGTPLFRLYAVGDAVAWQGRLARHRLLSRTFAHTPGWLRLGLPAPDEWNRVEAALC